MLVERESSSLEDFVEVGGNKRLGEHPVKTKEEGVASSKRSGDSESQCKGRERRKKIPR